MFKKLWSILRQEPVRAHLYSLVVLGLGFLYAKHYVNGGELAYLGALAASILGVENLRSRVTPSSSPPDNPPDQGTSP